MSRKAEQLASVEEIEAYEPEVKTKTVQVGPFKMKLQEILDPIQLTKAFNTAKGRRVLPVKIDGVDTVLPQGLADAFTFLEFCLVEPKLNFLQIVKLSRKTGLACMEAGGEAMDLCGLTIEAVEETKKNSEPESASDTMPG